MGLSQTIIPKEQRKLTPSFSDQHDTILMQGWIPMKKTQYGEISLPLISTFDKGAHSIEKD